MANARIQVAVIGLGPFGRTVCRALMDVGHEVLAIDPRAEAVREVNDAGLATVAAQADPESLVALEELDVPGMDVAVVGRGTDFEASLLTVMNLLELGVPQIVAKAVNDRHAQVLARVGGERVRVIYPERDMGLRLVYQLSGQDIMEAVWTDPQHSFAEWPLPAGLAGRTLAETQVRRQLGVLVVAVRRGGRLLVAPEPDLVLEADDQLVVLGRNERLAAPPHQVADAGPARGV